jgi:hypothetical protein
MYINLFWIGVAATIMFEIGLVFLAVGISYVKGKVK